MDGDSKDLAPWQRQPGEPPRAWLAFSLFLSLGEQRTVANAAREWLVGPCSPGQQARAKSQARYREHMRPERQVANMATGWRRGWAGRWSWAFRAERWDTWVAAAAEEQRREAAVREKVEASEATALSAKLRLATARRARDLCATLIEKVFRRIGTEKTLDTLPLDNLLHIAGRMARLLEVAMASERLELGLPDRVPAGTGEAADIPLTLQDLDELRQAALAREARAMIDAHEAAEKRVGIVSKPPWPVPEGWWDEHRRLSQAAGIPYLRLDNRGDPKPVGPIYHESPPDPETA